MNTTIKSTALGCVVIITSALQVDADENRICTPFKVYSSGEFREFVQIDMNKDGVVSEGDRLLGHRKLQDEAGNQIGDRYFSALIKKVSADGKTLQRSTEVVNVLKDGAVYTTKHRVAGSDLPSTIHGGTGLYKGIKGTVKVYRDGPANVYHFLTECDQPEQS